MDGLIKGVPPSESSVMNSRRRRTPFSTQRIDTSIKEYSMGNAGLRWIKEGVKGKQ